MINNKLLLNNVHFGNPQNDCIILIHGFLGSSEIWNSFIPKLQNNYQILTIDLPGHGKSNPYDGKLTMELIAENVKTILENHNIKNAHFLGHSMGGYVSLAILDLFPEIVKSITLLNSTAKEDSEQKKNDRLLAMKVFDLQPKVFIQAAIENLFYSENLIPLSKEVKKMQEIALQTNIEGAKASLMAMRNRKDYCDLIQKTLCPILYISGMEDTTVPFKTIQDQIQNTNVNLIAIEKSGHMCFVESFEVTLNGFINFIKKYKEP